MSYDLAVWEGARPANDEAASNTYERIMPALESPATDPPREQIRAYVGGLLNRWPDIATGADDSPWADGPLIDNTFGTAIYFSIVWSQAAQASACTAQVAAEHGIVCFDPQLETLRRSQPPHGCCRGDQQPGPAPGWSVSPLESCVRASDPDHSQVDRAIVIKKPM